MATYKKRGQKKTTNEPVQQTIEETQSTTADVFNSLDETATKSEQWIEKYQKPLFGALLAVVIVILGSIAYTSYIVEPNEKEAADELAFPKENFDLAINATTDADSLFTLALNGSDGKYGFLDIARKFGSTKAGNLAKYYAGISYLKTKDYNNAIDYLSQFSSSDALIGPTALGAIGDAYADNGDLDNALTYYEKAATTKPNASTSPFYLLKAGNTALAIGNAEKAANYFTQIKEEYPNSPNAVNIEMHINKAKYAIE